MHKAFDIKTQKILTNNAKDFTDRLFASPEGQATGQNEFDLFCTDQGIEHRLTKPRTPQTNGMVKRFNGRIADVLKTHHFVSGQDLQQTLLRYVTLCNQHLPQAALKSKTLFDALKMWYKSYPHQFKKKPSNRPGCDT